MANETESNSIIPEHGQNPLTTGLAFGAGTGVILMFVAAAIGVIDGAEANGEVMQLLFFAGASAFIGCSIAWTGVVRPWENFDDINVGTYEGHHHDDHEEHDEHDEETIPALSEATPT